MSEGQNPPTPPPSGKRPAIGLQIKLPCASLTEIQSRYGDELRQNRFFIRTKTPRAKDTLVRLEAQFSDGTVAFRAVAVVARVHLPEGFTEPGMGLDLVGVDETARQLIAALGGKPPPPLKVEAPKPSATTRPAGPGVPSKPAPAKPDLSAMPGITPPPPRTASKPPAPKPEMPRPAPPPSRPDIARPPGVKPGPLSPQQPPLPEPSRRPEPPSGPPPVIDKTIQQKLTPPPPPAPPPAEKVTLKKGPMIGIDLGTTNSAAAVVKDGKPFVIPSREGYNTIPSIVALNDKGKLIIGHPAKSQLLINPHNTVYGAKRLIGRQFSSTVVEDLKGRFPYQIVEGGKGEAAVQLGEQQFSLQQISAFVLAEVKELAQQHLKTEVSRAVITVPAYYNDNQRNAVREAGGLAGIKVERILNEPTAAALAFAHGRNLDQRVLVYDLGGGTFDASVLELHGNVYEVVSTGGDTFLGGTDFDKVIVDHLLSSFKDQHGIDFPGDRVALQRVTDAAERAKIALSEQLEYPVKVPFVALVGDKPYDLEATLTRSELVLLSGHLIDRTLKVCEEVLTARGLKPDEVAEVLLVGGQSRMPLVRERIRSFFGKEPSKAVHPDEAVALGAAILANSIESGDIQGVVLVDVLAMSIGVGLPGGRFKRIIERNTSLPHKKSMSIGTTKDDQTALDILIFQGDAEKAQDNEYLGTLMIPNLPKAPRGAVAFEIVFALTPESILTVTAQEKKTGRTVTANFSTRDTPEQVRKKLVEDAEPVRDSAAAVPANGAGGGGAFGWLKRLFGGGGKPPETGA